MMEISQYDGDDAASEAAHPLTVYLANLCLPKVICFCLFTGKKIAPPDGIMLCATTKHSLFFMRLHV